MSSGIAEPDRPRRRRARCAGARGGGTRERRGAFPAGRGARRRAPTSPPARPRIEPSRSPMSSSANGSSPTSRPCSSTKRMRRLRRLVVALDRRRLAVAGHALVRQRDVHDVGVVRRLPRDDERLRELQPDDPGFDLHAPNLLGRARDRDDVGDDVRLLLPGDDPGGHDAAALLDGGWRPPCVEAGLEERGPTPPPFPPSPWQPAHSRWKTVSPR